MDGKQYAREPAEEYIRGLIGTIATFSGSDICMQTERPSHDTKQLANEKCIGELHTQQFPVNSLCHGVMDGRRHGVY